MLLPILGLTIALAAGAPGSADDTAVPTTAGLWSDVAWVEAPVSGEGRALEWRGPLYLGLDDWRVWKLQQHLTDLGVFRGEVDGVYGRETAAAVVAVHKLAGMDRTDVWQYEDWKIELDHDAILARNPDEMDRLEIDLARQVLFVIRAGEIVAILPVSSGNGEVYWSQNGGPGGGYVHATTPKGDFRLIKHIDGWRKNYLGNLYKPWYFTPYYAVHGSGSVPAHPASHGCVRIPTWEADNVDSLFELGLPVHIWDEPYVQAGRMML